MKKTIIKRIKRNRSHARIRSKVSGTAARPRLCVFKSNKFLYAQLIDDAARKTLASASTMKSKKGKPVDQAKDLGKAFASDLKAKKITKIVFDRGGYIYSGKIKAFADGLRDGGLDF
jgi:large subunit ribosomal protein L18